MKGLTYSLAPAAFALAATLVLVACGAGGQIGTSTPGVTPASLITPGRSQGILVASGSQPVAFDFAPDGRIFFTERTLGEIRVAATSSAVTPEDEARPPVVAARQQLAAQEHVDVSLVQVLSVTPKEWPDSCLGLPAAREACSQVVTPGFEVVFRAVTGSGTFIYRTDQGTQVRLDHIEAGGARSQLFATVDAFQGSECGLLGIAVDPDFATNHYVYIYATQPVAGRTDVGKPRIIRFTDVDGQGTEPTAIVDNLPTTNPKTCAHVSGNLHFGADGYLYVSVGNFEEPETSADLSLPTGKILRINKADGSAAPDNPFVSNPTADKRVFAYGLRNSFDFTFDPATGTIYAPDNGPGNCDELNIIVPGGNYGVPGSLLVGDAPSCLGLGGIDPIYLFAKPGMKPEKFGSNVAPAGVAFLPGGDRYRGLEKGVLVCEFNTGELHLLELAPSLDRVSKDLILADCTFNVEVHNGNIYYSNIQGVFELPPTAVEALPGPTP